MGIPYFLYSDSWLDALTVDISSFESWKISRVGNRRRLATYFLVEKRNGSDMDGVLFALFHSIRLIATLLVATFDIWRELRVNIVSQCLTFSGD